MAALHAEWALKAGRTEPTDVWRYSDAVVLISRLSKSCSCGIKTDTVQSVTLVVVVVVEGGIR